MKFVEYKYKSFEEFEKVMNSVFNDIEFTQSLPKDCSEYSLKAFKNKGDLKLFLKDRFINKRQPYITLSGSLVNVASDEVVVLLLSDITEVDNTVCLGGVFSC